MGRYQLTWQPLGKGQMAIGHRPGKALRKALEESGCTQVVSLLSYKEKKANDKATTLRLPLDSADPPSQDRIPEVLELFAQMIQLLDEGGKLYLHCSAGLHRTGMIMHAFLRYLGFSRDEAMAQITALRELTAQEVKEHRLAWGDPFEGGWVSQMCHHKPLSST